MFPLRSVLRHHKERLTQEFKVNQANTHRLKASAIPYIKGLLNKHARKSARLISLKSALILYVPVNSRLDGICLYCLVSHH